APELASAFDALVRSTADAVRQWTYDPPAEAPLSIRVTFAFPLSGKPRLVAHDGWSLMSPGQVVGFDAPGGRGGARSSGPPPPPPPPPPPAATGHCRGAVGNWRRSRGWKHSSANEDQACEPGIPCGRAVGEGS